MVDNHDIMCKSDFSDIHLNSPHAHPQSRNSPTDPPSPPTVANLTNKLDNPNENLISNDEINSRLTNTFLADYANELGLYQTQGEVLGENAKHAAEAVKDGLVTVAKGAKEGMVMTGKAVVDGVEKIGEAVSNAWDWLF